VIEFWAKNGVFERIERKKKVQKKKKYIKTLNLTKKHTQFFREPRNASSVESTLREYSNTIKEKESGGAILTSICGGKMSEGINFADDLARAVVMIGLPYPNSKDPILNEKIKYMEKMNSSNSFFNGRDYYENLCMKSVNQSIGKLVFLPITLSLISHFHRKSDSPC